MSRESWTHFKIMVRQGVRAELADKERIVSPILFAMTVLLLFSFAMGKVEPGLRLKWYTAETFLTAFFALQLGFSRIFEPDREDKVFDLLRSYPLSHGAWFLAKYTLVFLLGAIILVPTMLFGALLLHDPNTPLLSLPLFAVAILALAGLASLGVLLSAMTLKAEAKQLLYPILYFPLTTPVLLAAVQSTLALDEGSAFAGTSGAWLGLLACFDIIYFTLGFLLFPELVDDT